MKMLSECPCGGKFEVEYTHDGRWWAEGVFKQWMEKHKDCPQNFKILHVPFREKIRDRVIPKK